MHRLGVLLLCGCAADPTPPVQEPEAPSPTVTAPADAAVSLPGDAATPPAEGRPCDTPDVYGCDGDLLLRCRAGSGGARWMSRGECPASETCVDDWGCLPLTPCDDAGLLSCVDQTLFRCDEAPDGVRRWVWNADCPAAIPCVDGRGCPNPLGIGERCSFLDPPRCVGEEVMTCELDGIDAGWSAPGPCPGGDVCVEGEGCGPRNTDRFRVIRRPRRR